MDRKETSTILAKLNHWTHNWSPRTRERLVISYIIALPFILYRKFLTGKVMLYGSDWLIGGYAHREYISTYIRTHWRLPLWDPYIFGGMPTVAAFQGDLFYPTTLFRVFFPIHIVWAWSFAVHIAIAGLGIYYLCKDFKLPLPARAIGAIGYMFCGSLVSMTFPGHDGKLIAAALLPLAFFFFNRALNTAQFYYFIFAGATVGFSFLAGHVQATYYGLWALCLFLIFRLCGREFKLKHKLKISLYSLVALAYCMCLMAVQYLPVLQYMDYSVRGGK